MTEQARSAWVDTVVAFGLLLATQVELWLLGTPTGPRWLLVAVDLSACVPLLWRRSRPAVAVAGAVLSLLLPFLFRVGGGADLDAGFFSAAATLFTVHAAGAYLRRRPALIAVLVVLVAQYVRLLALPIRHSGDYMFLPAFVLASFGVGLMQAFQRRELCVQSRRTLQLMQEQQEREQRIKHEERRQIARELHDVIAHGVALMVVQAGAAEAVLGSDPAGTRRLLNALQETGERAAQDLRRQLGVLGQEDSAVVPAPQLENVAPLVTQLRGGGLRVTLTTDGNPASVEPGIGLVAYRIVQESLTNVMKHAADARVQVDLRVDGVAVEIRVTDDGGAPAQRPSVTGSGHGLVGMRERVELYGGQLDVGPAQSGWSVRVRLPLDSTVGPALTKQSVAS